MSKIPLVSVVACLSIVGSLGGSLRGNVVLDWNRVTSDVLVADTHDQNPGMASRSMAMVNLAMYDAINIINGVRPQNVPFYSHTPAPAGTSAEAAAVQAGYRVLRSIYPGQRAMLDAQRAISLGAIADGREKMLGVRFGDRVGRVVVDERANDGWNRKVPYTPTDEPGYWQPDALNPEQQAWGPGWGDLDPFAIESSALMIPPPMPAMDSQKYADAFNEVKELGARNSAVRTPEQTEIGLFWAYDRLGMGTPMRLYNQILRNVAEQQGNDLSESAALFAQATVAMADAGIVAWDAKFEYDFWRPVTGIRHADEDGNDATEADPEWTPLGAPGGIAPDGSPINDFTPAFPTYISGHATFGGALFESLSNFYGTDDIAFEVTSDEVPGVVRSFDSFGEAMAENGRSRVYLGIHWNFDDIVGRHVGQQIADAVAANYFEEACSLGPFWQQAGGPGHRGGALCPGPLSEAGSASIPEPATWVLLALGVFIAWPICRCRSGSAKCLSGNLPTDSAIRATGRFSVCRRTPSA